MLLVNVGLEPSMGGCGSQPCCCVQPRWPLLASDPSRKRCIACDSIPSARGSCFSVCTSSSPPPSSSLPLPFYSLLFKHSLFPVIETSLFVTVFIPYSAVCVMLSSHGCSRSFLFCKYNDLTLRKRNPNKLFLHHPLHAVHCCLCSTTTQCKT